MNFLGIGVGELLLIMIIAAMVVGPERMVGLSRQAGRLLGKLRRETDSITREFREAISTFDEVGSVADETKAALSDIGGELKAATNDAKAAVGDIKQEASAARSDAVAATATVGTAATVAQLTAPKPAEATYKAVVTPAAKLTPPQPASSARPDSSTPVTAATVTAPAAASTARRLVPLLDGEVAAPAVKVAHAPDEARTVALAEVVPDDVADIEPVDVELPTLMIVESPIEPKPKAKRRAAAPVSPAPAAPLAAETPPPAAPESQPTAS